MSTCSFWILGPTCPKWQYGPPRPSATRTNWTVTKNHMKFASKMWSITLSTAVVGDMNSSLCSSIKFLQLGTLWNTLVPQCTRNFQTCPTLYEKETEEEKIGPAIPAPPPWKKLKEQDRREDDKEDDENTE
ncbi:unnamed protein product [Nezara viridula]|uniref:Uncharacterized protein n=1 Tax=Nezara viridula TaxID=85310 RepID=A0A9P0EDH6_NEZVI|nr:unnamed protein product [Nezara viridula]